MKVLSLTVVVAVLLACPARGLALGEEKFGNAPAVKQPEWADGVLEVVNLESRIYSRWVNGNENFYYKGELPALNETLRKFSAIKPGDRQLILLPGRGKTNSFHGKPIVFDWRLHVPSGIYRSMIGKKQAVLTVYINVEKSGPLADREKVAKWIRNLDDNVFETRQTASAELEKLGVSIKSVLREAQRNRPSPEMRRRLEALLAKMSGIDTGDLVIPEGVEISSASDQVEALLKELTDKNKTRASSATFSLGELAAFSDKIVPALANLVKNSKSVYLRECAVASLRATGVLAKAALPTLKDAVTDQNMNLRTAVQAAIDEIEKAKPDARWEAESKRMTAILKDINELKLARTKRAAK